MAKLDRANERDTQEQATDPKDLVVRAFSRCQNYPKESAGIQGLAQGLAAASRRCGVSMEAIVRACTDSSVFCPTDTDLLAVAKSLKPVVKVGPRVCDLGLCDGSGWVERFALHTHHVNGETGGVWVEKTALTREQYDDLSQKIDWKTQRAYSARKRCQCHPARPEEIEKRGKYA